ncbi:YciI family protein [Arthrobacter sp. MMS18-M83]|uniref:YciI family protein n=1 Tax=Arthrobacter sp. MMS18-M83 TaxID=2996261 RepID=UPI00227B9A43|nr:YciI family protein [Arthrobacter sp. MMS18-M83]WAH98680.1 YciI family protein [Arthrobacter sp. MMS18-M83]
MSRYLLSIYQPDGPIPEPGVLNKIMADLEVLNQEMHDAGAWVFTGGLHPSSTSTVVRVNDGEVLTTDGPFVEAKEHVGGLWVIEASDLDVALEWGRKAAQATTLPIEVRPFAGYRD